MYLMAVLILALLFAGVFIAMFLRVVFFKQSALPEIEKGGFLLLEKSSDFCIAGKGLERILHPRSKPFTHPEY